MKAPLILTAALALVASAALAQTVPPSQPATMVGTATSSTPKYSSSKPTPMNSTTDRMADQNGVGTSATMTQRQMDRQNERTTRREAKRQGKAGEKMKAKM